MDIASAALRVMSHQEKMAEFDRECEKRQRERERRREQELRLRLAQPAGQQGAAPSFRGAGGGGGGGLGTAGTAAYGSGPGARPQQLEQQRPPQRPAPAGGGAPPGSSRDQSGGGGGDSGDESDGGSESGSGDDGDDGGGGVPMEELIARSRLEEASLNLVMEAMWAANVVDIQATLSKVGSFGNICRNWEQLSEFERYRED